MSVAGFWRVWLWFSCRQFRLRFWRTLAVLIGVGLGAAVFTSVRLAVTASLDSFEKSMDLVTGKADLRLAVPGGGVPETLVATLLRHPSVAAASPVIDTYVRVVEPGSQVETGSPRLVRLLGIDPILDKPFRQWPPAAGQSEGSAWLDLMGRPGTVMAGGRLARDLGLGPGRTVTLSTGLRQDTVTVLGVLPDTGLAGAEGGWLAVADMATAQEFLGRFGVVDRIDLILAPGASPAALASALPPGVIPERPSEARESGRTMVRAYEANLTVLSFVSLFVGMFLVYSLIALNAASRRHEIAVLRSLGATRRLVFLVFLADGALLGLAGWLTAIPISAFLVEGLVRGVSSTISTLFVRVSVERLAISPLELILSLGLTLAVSLAGAARPAAEAMAVPPREVLLAGSVPAGGRRAAVRSALTGLLLLAPVHPLLRLHGTLPGYGAVFLLFIGFSLLAPGLLALAGRFLPGLVVRTGGAGGQGWPAFLAARWVREAGPRAAVSVGALITATALFAALAIMIHSFRETFSVWLNESISGDLFVRNAMAEATEYRDPLPEPVRDFLRSQPGLDLLPYVRLYLRYGTVPYQLEPIDAESYARHARFLFVRAADNDPAVAVARLRAGQGVIVAETFANRTGLGPGDRFRAEVRGVRFDLPILGVVRSYRTRGGVVFMSLPHYAEATEDRSWGGVRVFFQDRGDLQARTERLRAELLALAPGVEAMAGEDLRREVVRIFDQTFSVTTVLLVIALAVAALGITTTLTVLVLERGRHLATLRAVGASAGQVRAMIVWEALLLVLTGEAAGLTCGLILSRILVFDLSRESFGWTFVYSVDMAAILPALPLILLTALAASLPAVRLALKAPPAAILRER